jgi:hypothetical protein
MPQPPIAPTPPAQSAPEPRWLYYAFSTIAQCAAALVALIGFLGLWRMDRLREERDQTERDLRGLLLRVKWLNAEEAMILSIYDLIQARLWPL